MRFEIMRETEQMMENFEKHPFRYLILPFIILGIIAALLVIPLLTKAEAPSDVFGFMDGKFYDQSQTLKYICFLDNNCYDINQNFAFKRTVAGATNPQSSNTLLNLYLQQAFPVSSDNTTLPKEYQSVICINIPNNILSCRNNSRQTITVKEVLFAGINYPSYQEITENFKLASPSGGSLYFESDPTNTVFYGNGFAKTVFDFSDVTLLSSEIKDILISENQHPYLILITINGKDVVYKVQ